jgi:AraC-like DNA-binding protein
MAPHEPLMLLDAGLRGTLVALLLLLATMLWRDRPRLAAARATIALCLGLVVQVVSGAPWVEAHLSRTAIAPWVGISVGNAVLFWLFVQALFDDGFVPRVWQGALWLAVVLLAAVNCAWLAGSGSALSQITMGVQRAVPLVFAVLAAVAAARRWNDDLVESRRRLRSYAVTAGVAYTVLSLLARLGSPHGRFSAWVAFADTVLLLLTVLPSAWRVLRVSAEDLFPSAPFVQSVTSVPAVTSLQPAPVTSAAAVESTDAPSSATPGPAAVTATPALSRSPSGQLAPDSTTDPEDERVAQALQRLMEEAQVYREEGLSVATLAARLRVPEYRLRRVINQRLGHRNFNAYVNGLRLEQACKALADPALRHVPVLSIALDAGFQSIGPFNRAFKAAMGVTPTDYRRHKLADS